MSEYAGKNVNLVSPPRKSGKGTYLCACCHLAKIAKELVYCGACEGERADEHSRFHRIGHCAA